MKLRETRKCLRIDNYLCFSVKISNLFAHRASSCPTLSKIDKHLSATLNTSSQMRPPTHVFPPDTVCSPNWFHSTGLRWALIKQFAGLYLLVKTWVKNWLRQGNRIQKYTMTDTCYSNHETNNAKFICFWFTECYLKRMISATHACLLVGDPVTIAVTTYSMWILHRN